MDTTMMYASFHEDQPPLNENNMMNVPPLVANDSNSECNVGGHTEPIVPTNVCKNITLEDVMKEIVSLRQLVHDMKEGTNTELFVIKATCISIEETVKTLEELVVSKCQRDELMKETSKTTNQPSFVGMQKNAEVCVGSGSKGKDIITNDVEMTSFETQSDATQCEMAAKPFVPDVWLNAYNSVDLEKEINEPEIYRSQYKRTAELMNEAIIPSAGETEIVSKKLFHTPSPKGTPGQTSKYALTYAPKSQSKSRSRVSESKDRLSSGESASKKSKQAGSAIPKGAKLNFRPTYDMMLAPIEAQACAYLFQKTNSPVLMMEDLVKVGGLTATRSDLLALLPTRPITEMVLTLAAEKVRFVQAMSMYQLVWCLPPTFVADIYNGMKLNELSEKYMSRWMPPYEKLKFIYIPMVTVHAHWYLMIIDVERGVIYHLDTYCSLAAADLRKGRMKKICQVLHRLVLDPDYTLPLRNKKIDFMNMDIVEARGIPNTGRSDNSGVWLLDWIHMEHYFDPNNIYGNLKDNEVRMKTAARLLLGPHNELKNIVKDKTLAYISLFQQDAPLDVEAEFDD